jgi:hypothetical protein
MFRTCRVVANNIDPGGTAFSAGTYQCGIVSCQCESHLDERVWQPQRVKLFVKLDEAVGDAECCLVRDREFEFLVQVINRAAVRTVAFQDEV